jgi:hypothetical protein
MSRPSSIVRWRVHPDEHYRAVRTLQREHARQERRIWRELRLVLLAIFVLIAVAIVVRRWREIHHAPVAYMWVFGVPLVMVGIYAATRPIALKRAVKRQLDDDPSTRQERAYTMDAAGLKIDGESFHVELNWAQLIVVRETNEFLLFVTRKSAFYLPKRAIQWPERLEGIRELLDEYLGDRADVR